MNEIGSKITVIRIADVRPGMCLAQPVFDHKGIKLLDQGTVLASEEQIAVLRNAGIAKILVDIANSVIQTDSADDAADRQAFIDEFDDPETIVNKLKEEVIVAKKVYESTHEIVHDLMQNIRLGQNVDCQEVRGATDELIGSVTRNPAALLSLINLRKRDESTFTHSINVAVIALSVARHLNLNDAILQKIGVAALMHDIGKSRIPQRLLNKGSRYTAEEFEILKMHTLYGVELCKKIQLDDDIVLDIVRHHHESYDGQGYPDQLAQNAISRYAALVGIADCYDALTTDYAYKPRLEPPAAIHVINSMSNSKFDRRLVYHFVKTIGIYPIGSIVELSSKRIAIVLGFAQRNLLRPVLKVLVNADGSTPDEGDLLVFGSTNEQISNISPNFQLLSDLDAIL